MYVYVHTDELKNQNVKYIFSYVRMYIYGYRYKEIFLKFKAENKQQTQSLKFDGYICICT